MNKGLTGLERHEGEKLMTEFNLCLNYPFEGYLTGLLQLDHRPLT